MKNTIMSMYRKAVMHKRNPTRKEVKNALIEELRNEDAAIELAADFILSKLSKSWWQVETPLGVSFERIANKRKSNPLADKARSDAALANLKAEVGARVLMDLELPNGKPLRFATGADCVKAGGFYEAIGRAIAATETVGNQLTEQDLQNILTRTHGKNYFEEQETSEC